MAEKSRSLTDEERALVDDGLALLAVELHTSLSGGAGGAVERTVLRALERLDSLSTVLGVADRLVVSYDAADLAAAEQPHPEPVRISEGAARQAAALQTFDLTLPAADDELPDTLPADDEDDLPGELPVGAEEDGITNLGGLE